MFFVVSTKLTALLLLTKSGILSALFRLICFSRLFQLSWPSWPWPIHSPALPPGAHTSGILSVPAGSSCLSFPAVARPLRSPALRPGAPLSLSAPLLWLPDLPHSGL